MRRITGGDRDAFACVVDVYMADVFRFSYSIMKDRGSAEDITQETFFRLWIKAAQWKPDGRLKAWLMRIAHNLCIDEIRGRKESQPVEGLILSLVDEAPDQIDLQAEKQVSDIVQNSLFSLPERQRTALILVYYQGSSNSEAATIMNLSVDALESLLARGRQKMKTMLKGSKTSLLEG